MSEKLFQEHNQILLDQFNDLGPATMGPYCSETWRRDPKHVLFTMARYKFCSKILQRKKSVLDVGCGDGTCLPILLQVVDSVHAIDLEPVMIELNKKCYERELGGRVTFEAIDVSEAKPAGLFEAAVSLDVIEHIEPEKEKDFLKNISDCLVDNAICIIGTPNITADAYASENSRAGHINLKSHETLGELLELFFENVLLFSMNDEVVHTGFHPMAHYVFAIGIQKKG